MDSEDSDEDYSSVSEESAETGERMGVVQGVALVPKVYFGCLEASILTCHAPCHTPFIVQMRMMKRRVGWTGMSWKRKLKEVSVVCGRD